MARALRLLVGAALALVLLAAFAGAVQYVYTRYAQRAESGVVSLLEYWFRERKPATPPPAALRSLSEAEIARCREGEYPDYLDLGELPAYFSTVPPTDDEFDSVGRFIFGRILCAIGELPLAAPELADLARLRLVLLPSFSPGFVLRIEHSRAGDRLAITELEGKGLRPPYAVARRIERPLADEQWEIIRELLARTDFWNVAPSDARDGRMLLDGDSWLVELTEGRRYHMVHRMNGEALRPLVEHLAALARLEAARTAEPQTR